MTHLAPPVVSFAGLHAGDGQARADVVAAVRAACLDKGFLYVVDHAIPAALIDAVFAQSKRFFELPVERKLAVDMALSPWKRGYEPLRGQALEAGALPDLKEGFYMGNELAADDPRVVAGLFNHGPNQWPADLPGWRETMMAYFARMEALCRVTMQVLASALDLERDHFAAFCETPVSNLRLLHYPPQPGNPRPGEKGCGAHTDWGAVTFLLQDDVGGLQVWDGAHGWIEAPPVPGAFVVNLGDLISRWTNDRFRSTLHRVINRSGKVRYSVPFFFTGRPDHRIECLPNCRAPGEAARYAPTTALGHLQDMYERSYAPV